METRTIILGVGVLAIGGFLAWKFLGKQTSSQSSEQPSNEPKNQTAEETTRIGLELGKNKPAIPIDNAGEKPSSSVNTKLGGSKPVQGFAMNPNLTSNKSPFVNASVMKSLTIRLSNGDVVNLKKGDKLSVANNYGESAMTYVEGSTSQKLKWDVDVYYPRSSSGVNNANTSVGSGGAPQFDGGQKKRHNFPYFY